MLERSVFKRDGIKVLVDVPITVAQAILGGTTVVPSLSGEVELKIPKGTQPIKILQIGGKGIKQLNGGRYGNQMVTLKIEIPTHLTEKQQKLMEEYLEEESKEGSHFKKATPECHNFKNTVKNTMDRIKSFFLRMQIYLHM